MTTDDRRQPPVVFLHGWGGTFASTWQANGFDVGLAGTGRAVVGADLPGHGPGSHSHDPADYADLASAVVCPLPEDEAVDGVGFSLGAKVLLEIACREPGRFRRLVLGGLGANVFAPERAGEAVAAVLEQGLGDDTPPAVRSLVEYGLAAGNDPLAIAACLRRPPNPVLTAERLAAVTCPVLLIAGDADTLAQPLAPLADALATVQIEALPGATHLGLPADRRFRHSAISFLQKAN